MDGIRACVFDAYGTLFDVHSAVGRLRPQIGAHADELSQLWRTKQLEYSWRDVLAELAIKTEEVAARGADVSFVSCMSSSVVIHAPHRSFRRWTMRTSSGVYPRRRSRRSRTRGSSSSKAA